MSSAWEKDTFSIKITNFINPHLFHFKLENIIVGQTDIDVEKDLDQYAKEACWKHQVGYHPKERERIAAYVLEWKKWVRGEVDVVLDLVTGPGKQYIIWCLDHGIPKKLGAGHILPMPPYLQRLPATAYLGGLAKCAPIEKRPNHGMEYEVENSERFDDFVNTYAKRLLDEASEIQFKPLRKMDNNHIFGDIRILKHSGHKVDLLRQLMIHGGVKLDEHDIPFGIENWETTKTPRYKTDRGLLNCRQVPIVPFTSPKQKKQHRSAMSVCSNDLNEDDKIVLSWSRQNTVLARHMDRAIKNRFDAVIYDLHRYMMTTRDHRQPHNLMFCNAMSLPSINQSNSNICPMYGSQSTLSDAESIAAQSDVASTITSRTSSRFTQRLQATKQPAASTSKTTTNKKTTFIPSGYERDVLEFHKYNDL